MTTRMRSTAVAVALAFAVVLPALASRNGSGSYSLPTGNPVIPGTTISTTWANNTLGDIGTELTSSLDRQGRGCMLAPLQLTNGTAGAPSLTFCTETTSGLYRASAGDVRLSVGGADRIQQTTTRTTLSQGITATATTNTSGATFAGNGTGPGVSATGGSNAAGGSFTAGGGNNNGVTATGAGTAAGGSFTGGGTNGTGVTGTGGATNGAGVTGQGTGSGAGGSFTGGSGGNGVVATSGGTLAAGVFACGTAATGGTRQDAVVLSNGDLNMSSVANPTSTTALTNRLTPSGLVKAWARIQTNGANGCTILGGMNVTSCSVNGFTDRIRITVASGLTGCTANGTCVQLILPELAISVTPNWFPQGNVNSDTTFDVGGWNVTAGAVVNFANTVKNVDWMLVGIQ